MPLELPSIDDRSYAQILDEAVARISVHNPEWTNFNDADPGITLLQLFSFMTESLLYRSRQIPDRNRVKFLTLLGVELQPASPASGIVTFDSTRGPLQATVLFEDLEVLAGRIPFRTSNGLSVLPVEAGVYYKAPLDPDRRAEVVEHYQIVYGSYLATDTDLVLYETRQVQWPSAGLRFPVVDLAADTVDGSLWVALLARTAAAVPATRSVLANQVLTVGVVPEITGTSRRLRPGGGDAAPGGTAELVFQLPRVDGPLPADPEQRVARYRTLDARASNDVLEEPGLVELPLPGEQDLRLWEDLEPLEPGVGDFPPVLEGDDADRVVTWLRIQPASDRSGNAQPARQRARLGWIGINAALVSQRTYVTGELLGRGTGEPDQAVRLATTPVLPDTLRLTVAGEPWTRIDDLLAAPPEVPAAEAGPGVGGSPPASAASPSVTAQVFTVDRESGVVQFGTGLHGSRPSRDARIEASYAHGGGRAGLVAIGAITKGPTLPPGVKVSNPLPTWGAGDGESVADAERRIPLFLRHRDRLVAWEDFEDITRATPGVDLGRVEVLTLFHPDLPDVESPGVVTVLVVPKYDPVSPEAPLPDRFFLDTVCAHLDRARLLTTEVHVRGPAYRPVWVSIGIEVAAGRDLAPVREQVKTELRRFLSPLQGGQERQGWPLSTPVDRLELWAVATRVAGVAKVVDVLLADEAGAAPQRVELRGLELPRLVAISVQQGEPQSIEELRGTAVAPSPTRLPVPVVPSEC